MRFDRQPGEQPQPWDTAKVAEAFADAQQLVLALDSESIAPYLEALDDVIGRTLEQAVSDADFADRLAYMVYGFALFGLGGLGAAEAATGKSREETLALIGSAVDTWLG